MRKSSKEEKRLQTEYENEAKQKAELAKTEKECQKSSKVKGPPPLKSEFRKLCECMGKCKYSDLPVSPYTC